MITSDQERPPTLREAFTARIRSKHYSLSTEKCYWAWIRDYCRHHGKHPRQLQPEDIEACMQLH